MPRRRNKPLSRREILSRIAAEGGDLDALELAIDFVSSEPLPTFTRHATAEQNRNLQIALRLFSRMTDLRPTFDELAKGSLLPMFDELLNRVVELGALARLQVSMIERNVSVQLDTRYSTETQADFCARLRQAHKWMTYEHVARLLIGRPVVDAEQVASLEPSRLKLREAWSIDAAVKNLARSLAEGVGKARRRRER